MLVCHSELALSLANVSVIACSVQIYSFVWLYIIRIIFLQSCSGITKGKAVLNDGGCHHSLREEVVLWSIMLLAQLFSCTSSARGPCTMCVSQEIFIAVIW